LKPKTLNLIQLNVAVLLWGLTAQFSKGVDLPVSHVICARSLVAAGALLAFLLIMRSPVKIKRPGHYWTMLILGVLLCAHWLTYFAAIRLAGAAVAILALHTYPVLTALVEPLVFREKLKPIDVLLAIVVFAGVGIMTPALSLSNKVSQGIALGVVSGLFFMARNLMTRKYVKEYTSSALLFYQTLVTGLVLLLLLAAAPVTGVALMPKLFLDGPTAYTAQIIGLLLLLGVVFTAPPQTLYSASFSHLSAKTVGVLATLLPFYGAFWGYVIHREKVTLNTAIGGLVILACIIFETLRSVKTGGNKT